MHHLKPSPAPSPSPVHHHRAAPLSRSHTPRHLQPPSPLTHPLFGNMRVLSLIQRPHRVHTAAALPSLPPLSHTALPCSSRHVSHDTSTAVSSSISANSSMSTSSSTSLSACSSNARRHSRRRRGVLCVCQAKKARGGGGTSTRQRKKAPSNKVSIGTNVRQTVIEEVLREESKATTNILPTGPLSKTSRHHRALVLDSAYRPINVWTWPKAVMMDVLQRCDVIDYYPPPAHAFSGHGLHKLPAVVRVDTYVDISGLVQQVSCTPRNIMLRDKFCCQYCGSKHLLTLDHMVPISKGGKSTWTNLVTACQSCNQKKGDKLITQLGWKLQGPPPREPKPHEVGFVAGLRLKDLIRPPEVWSFFLEPYRARMGGLLEEMAVVKEELNLDDD